MSQFINIHVLYTLAAANPNRDASGSPKSVQYGGVTRSRLSSQAMTRAKRVAFETRTPGERTTRSKKNPAQVVALVKHLAAEDGVVLTDEQIDHLTEEATLLVRGLTHNMKGGSKPSKKSAAGAGEDVDDSKDTLVWLDEREMLPMAEKLYATVTGAGEDVSSLDVADFVKPHRTGSLSIAAFGRMFANRQDLQNEAAIQRSHAITTHEAHTDVDFFTAVDDVVERTMKSGSPEQVAGMSHGSGHLDVAQMTGGVFYWSANIDVEQLLSVWRLPTNATETLAALIEALLLEIPSGKQNTMATHDLPPFVLVTAGSRPVSLQGAFETPVMAQGTTGFLQPSIDRLLVEHERVVAVMPSAVKGAKTSGTRVVDENTWVNFDDLARWVAETILPNSPDTEGTPVTGGE